MNLPERIQSKIVMDPCGCWLWTGHVLPSGYGQTWNGTKHVTIHRYVYELLVGPIENTIDHVYDNGCRHKHCCNPAHLEDVPFVENIRRRDALKTHCRKGHPLPAKGVRQRVCRVCANAASKKYRGAA